MKLVKFIRETGVCSFVVLRVNPSGEAVLQVHPGETWLFLHRRTKLFIGWFTANKPPL